MIFSSQQASDDDAVCVSRAASIHCLNKNMPCLLATCNQLSAVFLLHRRAHKNIKKQGKRSIVVIVYLCDGYSLTLKYEFAVDKRTFRVCSAICSAASLK